MHSANSTSRAENPRPETTMDLVWGGEAIATLIGKTKGATFAMLERGHIPGAKKIGGQWAVSRKRLLAHFEVAA